LCKRYDIDLSARTKHGALLDAELTAQVYLELLGGRQKKLSLSPIDRAGSMRDSPRPLRIRLVPLLSRLTPAEAAAHAAFVASELGKDALWNAFSGGS
jgi:DNA polymerase-3 subunit epsilon